MLCDLNKIYNILEYVKPKCCMREKGRAELVEN